MAVDIEPFPRHMFGGHDVTTDNYDDSFRPDDVLDIFNNKDKMSPERAPASTTPHHDVISTFADVITSPANQKWIFGEVEDTVILPILLLVIALFCLFGNTLLVFAILGSRSMRSGFNLMLLNVAVCDLIFVLVTIPTAIANHVAYAHFASAPAFDLCKVVHYVTFVTVYVSVYSIVVINVFCFCSEFMNSKGKLGTYLSRSNAFASCVVIWLAFLLSHVNILLQDDVAIFEEPYICTNQAALNDVAKQRTLWVTFLTCCFLLPILSVSLMSALIFHKQTKDNFVLKFQRHGYYENVSIATSSAPSDMLPRRQKVVIVMSCLAVRTLLWAPVQIFVLIDIFGENGETEKDTSVLYRKIEMLSLCCAFLSSCVQPLLLRWLDPEMRGAYRETLARSGCRRCVTSLAEEEMSDMNETILSVISAESANNIDH